jgi:hypothetical protein
LAFRPLLGIPLAKRRAQVAVGQDFWSEEAAMPLRSTFRRTLRASLTVAYLAAAGAVSPASAGGTDTFDLSVSGLPVGTITLRAEQSGGDYVATSRIVPSAVVSALTSYAFDGRATGRIDTAGKVTPVSFAADSTSPRATRRTEIEWRGDRPVRVVVEPPRKHAPDPDRVVGALDPVSASFALLRDNAPDRICGVSVDVFDGSRRSRLSLAEPVAAGDGFVCAGAYARLEGEAHTLSADGTYPFTLTFAPNGDGMVRLERIEARTRFGPAVIARRG